MRVLSLLLVLPSLVCAGGPTLTVEDAWNWREITEARISPNGRWLACVERWNDRATNAAYSNVWIASADGSARHALSVGRQTDSAPRWSADSRRLAWIGAAKGESAIYVAAAGSPAAIPAFGATPLDLAWSPDGKWLAVTARSGASAPQVFLAPVSGTGARRISTGEGAYSGEPAWTPDGETVLAVRDGRAIEALPVNGGRPRTLASGAAEYASLRVSPDGEKVAFLARDAKPQSYVVRKLYAMNADGSRIRALSGALDRDAADPQWSADSRTVYFLADDHGLTRLFAARNDGGLREALSAPERLRSFSLAEDATAAVVVSSMSAPGNAVTFSLFEPAARKTAVAANVWLAGRTVAPQERVEFLSGGRPIEAWVVKPPDFDATRKYPAVLETLEEPRAMCGYEFRLRAQIAAARGFVALCVNPRGVPGYGETFGSLLATGGLADAVDDIKAAAAYAAHLPFVDPRRVYLSAAALAQSAAPADTDFAAGAPPGDPIAPPLPLH